jgi:hypothetical protein
MRASFYYLCFTFVANALEMNTVTAAAYKPVGTWSAEIRRDIAPSRRGVQLTLRQQESVIPRVFDQPPTLLHEPSPEAGQDQVLIHVGTTSRCHRFPKLYASYAELQPDLARSDR